MYNFNKVRELRKQGKSFSAIGRQLGINRRTVAKYLDSNTPPKYSPRERSGRQDLLNDFRLNLIAKLEIVPKWSGEEAYAWLKGSGYKGSLRTVERELRIIRGEKPKERFFDQEYEPGAQCQFDFKEKVVLPFLDGDKIVQIHFATLPHSDACVMKGYPQKNYECFMDGVHSFFEVIGGMPDAIRFDNLSPCVKKVLPNGKRLYTKHFEAAIMYYDFEALPCSPGKGNEKGDVERDIQTHSRQFLNFVKINGITFESFIHLNQIMFEYFERTLTTEKYLEEVKHLNVLPPRDEDVLCRVEENKASPFGMVKFGLSLYTVPDEVIGVKCRIVGTPTEIKITRLDTNQLITSHARVADGTNGIKLEHIIKSILRKPRAMINWAHKEVLFPDIILKKYYDKLKKQDQVIGPEKEYLKILNLIHYVTLPEIIIAVDLVLQSGKPHSFEEIKSLLLNERRPDNVYDIASKFNQEPITTNLKDYDLLIPIGG
jgi:transposase